jgi:hypothetical protein
LLSGDFLTALNATASIAKVALTHNTNAINPLNPSIVSPFGFIALLYQFFFQFDKIF